MILLIDADSLIFASCYRTRDEENQDPYYRDIEDSIVKFDEQFMKIVNDLEEQYEIEKVITFNGSKGNFRKDRKSTRLNSSHSQQSRMPSSA